MSESISKISKSLQSLGLTENESKTIIGMIKIGSLSDATSISKISGVPRSKIYSILQKLNEIDLIDVHSVEGGTNYYEVHKIELVLSTLKQKNESQIKSALDVAESNLKILESSLDHDLSKKLDFMSVRGKEKIIDQISELLDYSNDNKTIILLPYITFKDISTAIITKLIEIKTQNKKGILLDIIVNLEEYQQIQSEIDGFEVIKENFIIIAIPESVKSKNNKFNGTENSNLLLNLYELFTLRPLFLIVGTESAFIIIEENYIFNSLRILNKEFLTFQQKIVNFAINLLKNFLLKQN